MTMILNQMKPTKSTGPDNINMKTIKELKTYTIPTLTRLFNSIVETEYYPANQKVSKIIPVHKPGELLTNPLGYRGINLLNSISKVVDKEMFYQMSEFLDENDIIPNNVHGARKNYSTTSAAASIHDKMSNIRDKNIPSAQIAIDKSMAYDIIKHSILIKKFKAIGFSQQALNIIQSYLENRESYVIFNTFKSKTIKTGPISAIQGGNLATLMYGVYSLDEPNMMHINCTIPQDICLKPKADTYVDDQYSIVVSDKWENLKLDMEKYMIAQE